MDFSSFSKEEPALGSDSESDDDYRPSAGESLSEEESGSEKEQPLSSSEEEEAANTRKRRRVQRPTKRKARRKSRKQDKNGSSNVTEEEKTEAEEKNLLTEEEEKKRVDSLWADFKKETGTAFPKSEKKPTEINGKAEEKKEETPKRTEKKDVIEKKVQITEVFEFAGEEVKVVKEVDANSTEAKSTAAPSRKIGVPAVAAGTSAPRGRGRGGGLSSVLSQLGKKPKIGTLEKSKLDWDSFKKQEGIEDDLKSFNRGKDGYLEKQDFLQRADLRQFEIEKKFRASRRSNR